MDEEKTYWRVGLFVCLSLLAALSLWWITGPGQLGDGTSVRIRYNYTGPIKPGALVRLSGLTVGRVQDVQFVGQASDPEGAMVELTAAIKPEIFNVLSDQTRFYVTTLGVLGEYYLDVEPRRGQRPLAAGDGVLALICLAPICCSPAAGFMEVLDALLVDNLKELIPLEQVTQLVQQGHELLKIPKVTNFSITCRALARSQQVLDALSVALGDGKTTGDEVAAGVAA